MSEMEKVQTQTPAQGEKMNVKVIFLTNGIIKITDGSEYYAVVEFTYSVMDDEILSPRPARSEELEKIREAISNHAVRRVSIYRYECGASKLLVDADDNSVSVFACHSPRGTDEYLTAKYNFIGTPMYLSGYLLEVLDGELSISSYAQLITHYWLRDVITPIMDGLIKEGEDGEEEE